MWEFLIKQESGLYKPKSIADLSFIEQHYSFDESQSNADAMLGEIMPFTYNGTSVAFENESSLPDSGTYFPFAQIDCYNNLEMLAASNTVAGAKTDLLAAIGTYGEKLVRVIHISTTVPFQPLPGGVTPADLALKQDKQLESTGVYINGAVQTTVEGALEATATVLNNMAPRSKVYITSPTNNDDHYYLMTDWSSMQGTTKTESLEGVIGNEQSGDVTQFSITIFAVNDGNTDQQTIQGYIDKPLADGCDILLTADQKIYIALNGANKYVRLYTSITPAWIEDTTTPTSTAPDNVVSSLSENTIDISQSSSDEPYELVNVEGDGVKYYKIYEASWQAFTPMSGVIFDGQFTALKYDILVSLNPAQNTASISGTYDMTLPENIDIIATDNAIWVKLPEDAGMFCYDKSSLGIEFISDPVAESNITGTALVSMSQNAINLSNSGGGLSMLGNSSIAVDNG